MLQLLRQTSFLDETVHFGATLADPFKQRLSSPSFALFGPKQLPHGTAADTECFHCLYTKEIKNCNLSDVMAVQKKHKKMHKRKKAKQASVDAVVDDLIAHVDNNVGYPEFDPGLNSFYIANLPYDKALASARISHLPSNIQEMVASLGTQYSLSDVPEALTDNLVHHSAMVNAGTAVTASAISNLVMNDPYAISANWQVGEKMDVNRNNRAAVEAALSFLRSPEARRSGPVVYFVGLHDKGEDRHATLAVVEPNGRISHFDPDQGLEANSGFNHLAMSAKDINASTFGLQDRLATLQDFPQNDCDYGMCGFLSYAVFKRGLHNASRGEPFDFDTAARDLYAQIKGDKRRARAFDYITIGQAARSAHVTPRAAVGAGRYVPSARSP